MRTEKARRYQVVSFCDEAGEDEKKEYSTVKQGVKAIRTLYASYDGCGIWDRKEKRYVAYTGYFPPAITT